MDEKVSSLEGRVADGVDGSTLGFIREETPGTTDEWSFSPPSIAVAEASITEVYNTVSG